MTDLWIGGPFKKPGEGMSISTPKPFQKLCLRLSVLGFRRLDRIESSVNHSDGKCTENLSDESKNHTYENLSEFVVLWIFDEKIVVGFWAD